MKTTEIKARWVALQVAEGQTEKRGLSFGEAVYNLRDKYKGSEEGYLSILNKLNIPPGVAYYWIAKYEESILTKLIGVSLPTVKPLTKPEAVEEVEEVEAVDLVDLSAESNATATSSSCRHS